MVKIHNYRDFDCKDTLSPMVNSNLDTDLTKVQEQTSNLIQNLNISHKKSMDHSGINISCFVYPNTDFNFFLLLLQIRIQMQKKKKANTWSRDRKICRVTAIKNRNGQKSIHRLLMPNKSSNKAIFRKLHMIRVWK